MFLFVRIKVIFVYFFLIDMDKDFSKKRKFFSVISIVILIIIFVFGFTVEIFSNAEEKSIQTFFSGTSIVSLSAALLLIGLFSWIIASRFLLKERTFSRNKRK